MKEIRRVLKPGGNLWTSWFLDPPNEENKGETRTVYRNTFVEELLRGFHKVYEVGGMTTMYHDQVYMGHRL
jgi:ubiquinone/menaquinone biosynthesis C-methylase UbiE